MRNETQHQPDGPGKGSWLSEATRRGEGRERAPSHAGEAHSRPAGWRCLPKRCSAGGCESRLRFSLLGRHEPSPPGLRVGLPQSGSCSGSVCYHVLNALWPRFRLKVFLIPCSAKTHCRQMCWGNLMLLSRGEKTHPASSVLTVAAKIQHNGAQ